MSIHSINNFNIAPIIPSLDMAKPTDVKAEFQQAFEDLNVEKIIDLLSNGADPRQKIEVTEKLSRNMLTATLSSCPRESLEEAFGSYCYHYFGDKIGNLDQEDSLIKRCVQVCDDLSNGLLVSDEAIRELFIEIIFKFEMNEALNKGDQPDFEPMQLAIDMRSLPLMQKLVECGIDYTDPSNFEVSLCYSDKEDILMGELGDLEDDDIEVPYAALLDSSLSPKERVGKIEAYLIEHGVNFSYDVEGFEREDFYTLSNFDEISAEDIAFIDFLLERGVALDQIFAFGADEMSDLAGISDPLAALNFLEKRGFDLLKFLNKVDSEVQFSSDDEGTNFCRVLSFICNHISARGAETVSFAMELINRNSAYFEQDLGEKFQVSFMVPFHRNEISDLYTGEANPGLRQSILDTYSILRELLIKGLSINQLLGELEEGYDSERYFSLAVTAILVKDFEVLEILVKENFDFNTQVWGIQEEDNYVAKSLLGHAAGDYGTKMDEEICRFLINHGARIESVSEELQEKLNALVSNEE